MKKLFGRKFNKYKFVTQEPTTKTCPNCGLKLEKIPNWKNGSMDYSGCEQTIVVRSGKLFTEDEANVIDRLDDINRALSDIEFTREDFNATREKLSREFGSKVSVNDTLWRMLTLINKPDKGYQVRKFIYFAMSYILRWEGKNTNEIMTRFHKMDLLYAKEISPNFVAIIHTSNDEYVCNECKKLSKMTFTIDEALRDMPIPHKCTNETCRCGYAFRLPD